MSKQTILEMCQAHFNEPVLCGDTVGRLIGYGEDEIDCYLIIRYCRGKVRWHTAVGGYIFLDCLRDRSVIISTQGEKWDDYFRIERELALNGSPEEPEFIIKIDDQS